MTWIGGVGAAAFAAAWIPQCVETLKVRRCDLNGGFLALSALGSVSLVIYSVQRGDAVFIAINTLTTAGALINLWYKAAGVPDSAKP